MRGRPQGFNTGKLVFISMYLYYDYYVNFDWCRKVPYSRNQLHAVRVWPECGRLTAGLFLLGVRPDRTPSKNGPESQGPREGQIDADRVQRFHGTSWTWCGFDRREQRARPEF